jgi:hypothetical protein
MLRKTMMRKQTMSTTLVAMYEEFDDARGAIEDLVDAGFDAHNIGFISNDVRNRYGENIDRDDLQDVDAGEGAGFGAVVGTLVGLGAALIPGVGMAIGAGELALSAGIGAAVGAATGSITAALVDMGIDEEEAHVYAESVRRGGTILSITVTNGGNVDQAEAIMRRYNPSSVDERANFYREQGWGGFENSAKAMTPDMLENHRDEYYEWQNANNVELDDESQRIRRY